MSKYDVCMVLFLNTIVIIFLHDLSHDPLFPLELNQQFLSKHRPNNTSNGNIFRMESTACVWCIKEGGKYRCNFGLQMAAVYLNLLHNMCVVGGLFFSLKEKQRPDGHVLSLHDWLNPAVPQSSTAHITSVSQSDCIRDLMPLHLNIQQPLVPSRYESIGRLILCYSYCCL